MEKMIRPLMQELKQAPEYAYLQMNAEFLALIAEFEEKLSTE